MSLNPKSLAQTFTGIGWKKKLGPEVDIVFGNNFWYKFENLTWQLKKYKIQKLHLNFEIRLK